MTLTLAIVGRPNVGKSTLFNRLTGKRHALVDDMPGVTRDRREGEGNLGPLTFTLIDTAGLEEAKDGTLSARMFEQTGKAVKEADAVLFVIDSKAGITPQDEHFADWLRRQSLKIILVANKAEAGSAQHEAMDAYRLGFGEPVAISAEHGQGLSDLYNAIIEAIPEAAEQEDDGEDEFPDEAIVAGAEEDEGPPPIMQLAIVGRPNVGKSTLLNKILGEERVLTGPEAGITRDAIAVDLEVKGRQLRLIDTAGMRKKAQVQQKLEKLAVADSLRSIQFAHVVILVLDAESPLDKQDITIGSLIEREGRAMIIAVNKWDLVPDPEAWLKAMDQRLEKVLPQMRGVPVIPVSALTGKGISQMLNAAFKVYDIWNSRVGTGELNRWLDAATQRHAPPIVSGRQMKLRYMTQTKTRPPTFALFVNKGGGALPEMYQRYLSNSLRETFDMPGVPIRIQLRKRSNPYDPT